MHVATVASVPDELELGDTVLQWREDGHWRAVSALLLEAERGGTVSPDPDDWTPVTPGLGTSGSMTCLYGQVIDGLPHEVTVDGQHVDVHTLGGLWAIQWDPQAHSVTIGWTINGARRSFRIPHGRHYLPA
jgi:hypothetical protein